ncbi:uncharacterized protein LTR77_002122 [Saxophila tyrrhenica]|uniref:BTB domain-containing protein n=1 Tax=Saxophila tyrrhenica TaxID=1690608 RepID=A0AAV9PM92_9PEZI|nr:hypothetical protein LTR77_002122 [Saxophila tyrrhenica]
MAPPVVPSKRPAISHQHSFDAPGYSDISVKYGSYTRRLHRIVLVDASEHLAEVVEQKNARFKGWLDVLFLEDSDPDAIEAVLRFAYGFDYDDIVTLSKEKSRTEFHLKVYTAASEYKMQELQEVARRALDESLKHFTARRHRQPHQDDKRAHRIFELVKLLTTYHHYEQYFVDRSKELVQRHLAMLLKLDGFLLWLTQDGSWAVDCLHKAVDQGRSVTEHTIKSCRDCETAWEDCGSTKHVCTSQPGIQSNAKSCATIRFTCQVGQLHNVEQIASGT